MMSSILLSKEGRRKSPLAERTVEKYGDEEKRMCLLEDRKFPVEKHWIATVRKVDMKLETVQLFLFLQCQGSFNCSFVGVESYNRACVVDRYN